MKKPYKIIIIALVLTVTVTTGLYFGISKYKESTRVSVGIGPGLLEEGEKGYFDTLIFATDSKVSEKTRARVNEVMNDLRKYDEEFKQKYTAPCQVFADYKNVNGKTVITYNGTATNKETNKTEEIRKTFEYDYVLVKDENDIQRMEKAK